MSDNNVDKIFTVIAKDQLRSVTFLKLDILTQL